MSRRANQIPSYSLRYWLGHTSRNRPAGAYKSRTNRHDTGNEKLHETSTDYEEIIIDGNFNFFKNVKGLFSHNVRTLVHADDLVPAVSAASIIAKVARDDYMAEMAAKYPGYGFEKHVGYGTAAHAAALEKHGVTDIHRKSFKPVQQFCQSERT
ncbi:ribonuclease HII [Candidatus Saccharibacteria bacterium]|nr:MAG: ribonuclease HII [Candidatus Saccharibacteria bacterium]